MMNRADVRVLAVEHLAELGVNAGDPNWETLLVADARLRGYRFQFDRVQVFWFFHSRTLEFYDADWRLLKLVKTSPAATCRAA
jgi:hypothetical protein